MARDDVNDFRHAAAAESVRIMRAARLSNGLNSEGSLCVPVEGDATGTLYWVALLGWVFGLPGLLLMLFGVAYVLLIPTPWVDASLKTFLIAGAAFGAGVWLCGIGYRTADAHFDKVVARRQGGGVLRDVESRVAEVHRFAIEDPATYRKQKIASEDYARGGMDRTGRGLILAGVQYLYVIRPGDVVEVREDKRHVVIEARVGEAVLTVAASPLDGDFDVEKRVRGEIVAGLRIGVGEGVV